MQKQLSDFVYHILVPFLIVILAFFIGDTFNLADSLNIHLRFDWAMTICTLFAGCASMVLGFIAIKQNEVANKLNNKLTKINEAQLESSILNQGYPSIKFCKNQIIEIDNKLLKLKFYDKRDIPLKEIIVENLLLRPLSKSYKIDDKESPIIIQKQKREVKIEYTPYHEQADGIDGFYFANIEASPEIFQKYKYFRLEFDIDVISTTGVVTTYKYRLLLERGGELNEEKNRRYPEVYHQFYEYDQILSEQKYRKSSNPT